MISQRYGHNGNRNRHPLLVRLHIVQHQLTPHHEFRLRYRIIFPSFQVVRRCDIGV